VRTVLAAFVLSLVLGLPVGSGAAPAAAQDPAGPAGDGGEPGAVPDPTEHFGFELGTDGRLADWDQLAAWYRAVGEASDRVVIEELGESTLGAPFLLVTVSSAENLERRERLAEVSRRLADPRGLDDAAVDELVEEGRAVVAVTVGLHSTEVAATQMAPLLVHRLATADDPETLRVLDEVVFLLFPSFNPDGTTMVADWVDQTRDTRYQGSWYPDLYHHYAGHDNNRDAYALNLDESRLFAEVVYRRWVPQMYLDVHQMGSYASRLYVPPYEDPVNPNVDPLTWIEHEMVGAHMQMALERSGVHGVVTGSPYTGWWFPSFHMVTNHHGIAGMLTETASTRMAWPLFLHRDQLRPHGRKHEVYGPMQLFPHPWEGGWWTMADMVRQQRISTWALLDMASRQRELVLRNSVFKARRTVERGTSEPPAEFVIPADQDDPLVVADLVALLMDQGVEVSRARQSFVHEGRAFDAGDYLVSTAQPKGVLVRSLLGKARYPDDATTRRADGSVLPPYDMAQFVLAEHMGVDAVPLETPVGAVLEELEAPPSPVGTVEGTGEAGWLLSHEVNASFRVANAVLAEGGEAYWLKAPVEAGGETLGPGAFWIPASESVTAEDMSALAGETGVTLHALARPPEGEAWRLEPLRLGMYRRYLGGNMDEGWTRLLFDRWGFPYERVEVDAVRGGALEDLDVFLIPRDGLEALEGEGAVPEPPEGEPEEYPEVFLPPEYTEGFDEEAWEALEAWVRDGGTLVLLDDASAVAWEKLGVPVEDAVADVPNEEYLCPGSTLRARFDGDHPLAYGMPEEEWILNWGSPVFAIEPTAFNDRIRAPVTYPREGELLRSGWLLGGDRLRGKAAALDVEYGEGRVLMLGFRAQHRAQTAGTFKVFFNALYYGAAEEVVLGEEAVDSDIP
ncbi:MAG: M14 metallopeptidase family protein, partial [Thermoanaerobaculia bacterium]